MADIPIKSVDSNYTEDADKIRPFARILAIDANNDDDEILISLDIGLNDHYVIFTVDRSNLLEAIGTAIAEAEL